MSIGLRPAPALQAARWLNAAEPLSLEDLRGRIVVIEAFQMLCPGCVSHGLPQARRIRETFREDDVAVIGLHSVFEHNDAQTPAALEAFLHENRIAFPVAVDAPGETGGLPKTMAAYGLQGTPTLILIDRQGRRRAQHFGHIPDLRLGAEIMALIAEQEDGAPSSEASVSQPPSAGSRNEATSESDKSFLPDRKALARAFEALLENPAPIGEALPTELPDTGIGECATLDGLAPHVLGEAAYLDAPEAFAHMDPPTPWISWALTLWNARLNQNLLHPATAPFARQAKERVVDWLAPFFGMIGGHMTPGSTVANLTALWAARETRGITRVIASDAAHLSVRKAARILGLDYETVPVDGDGRLYAAALGGLSDACLVLTAGTTSLGAVDPLALIGKAAWTHVDAAWAGPLRLTDRFADRLNGIETADSVAISAHKWLFQPKESALVLFRDAKAAHEALSFGGGYLAVPNTGLLGSHGATAIPLLGTLMAWGRRGTAERIERCMEMAERLGRAIEADGRLLLFAPPETGVVVFRPRAGDARTMYQWLPSGMCSTTAIGGQTWLRCVAANPLADMDRVIAAIRDAVSNESIPEGK